MKYDYYSVWCEIDVSDIDYENEDEWEILRVPVGTPQDVVWGIMKDRKSKCGHGGILMINLESPYSEDDYLNAMWPTDLTEEVGYAKLVEEQAEMAKVQDRLL
jgi:hypothetical protein